MPTGVQTNQRVPARGDGQQAGGNNPDGSNYRSRFVFQVSNNSEARQRLHQFLNNQTPGETFNSMYAVHGTMVQVIDTTTHAPNTILLPTLRYSTDGELTWQFLSGFQCDHTIVIDGTDHIVYTAFTLPQEIAYVNPQAVTGLSVGAAIWVYVEEMFTTSITRDAWMFINFSLGTIK